MPAKSDIDKVALLLRSDADEKRIAAAIVLGELKSKKPAVISGLKEMLRSRSPTLQRPALEAFAHIGSAKVLPDILPLLGSRDADVRERAASAIATAGESVVPIVRERMKSANPAERRLLDAILTQLGGKEAFAALLASFQSGGDEEIHSAAVGMRNELRKADAKQKKNYYSQTMKFFIKEKKRRDTSPAALGAAVKLLGYLEDPRAIPSLLELAKAKKQVASVRQEALIALRFAVGRKTDGPKIIMALMQAAESSERTLAQTALIALGEIELPARIMPRFTKLASHEDFERARFAMEKLSRQSGKETTKVLVDLLVQLERDRAELLVDGLQGRTEAASMLCDALVKATDPDRAWIIHKALLGMAGKLTPAEHKKLLAAAVARLTRGTKGWVPIVDIVRRADALMTAKALRTLVPKLKKARKLEHAHMVLLDLCAHDHATDDDRYALVTLEISGENKGKKPTARAFSLLDHLLRADYDVAGALRKDRSIGLDEIYSLGFHLVERDHPLGEELLSEVVHKAGNKKIGKMAQNKLKLAGFAD